MGTNYVVTASMGTNSYAVTASMGANFYVVNNAVMTDVLDRMCYN